MKRVYCLALLLALLCPVSIIAAGAPVPISPAEFKEKLVGPIVVIGTPFKSDGGIDHDGVREMVRRGLANDAKIFALTAGDSFYHQLSIDEVKSLTTTLIDAVGDDGIAIAATGDWPKEQVLDYAKFAEETGADAVQVLVPAKATDDEAVAFYRDVDEATQLGIVLHGKFSPEVLARIVEIESVVAMKEDISLEYLTDRLLAFGDRLNIFPGGSESRFLVAWPFGATAYYSGIYQFQPELAKQFWHAMKNQDIAAAREFVRKYDDPFMKNFTHEFWRASMAHFGVSERYMRPLDKSYTEEQMAEVKAFWERLGVTADEPVMVQ